MSTAKYVRIKHAAHYMYQPGKGHDLEQWIVRDDGSRFPAPSPDVPDDAKYSCGFLESGVQFWVFTRIAPLSEGRCDRCPKESA